MDIRAVKVSPGGCTIAVGNINLCFVFNNEKVIYTDKDKPEARTYNSAEMEVSIPLFNRAWEMAYAIYQAQKKKAEKKEKALQLALF
jgi:hypothetical protein